MAEETILATSSYQVLATVEEDPEKADWVDITDQFEVKPSTYEMLGILADGRLLFRHTRIIETFSV